MNGKKTIPTDGALSVDVETGIDFVGRLVQSVSRLDDGWGGASYAAGGPEHRRVGGFAWGEWWGVVVLAVVAVGAGVVGLFDHNGGGTVVLAWWLTLVRLLAYGVLSPSCVVLGVDRLNRGRRWAALLYGSLGLFFFLVLIANVLDLAGARDAVRVARMLVTPAALLAAFAALGGVFWGARE